MGEVAQKTKRMAKRAGFLFCQRGKGQEIFLSYGRSSLAEFFRFGLLHEHDFTLYLVPAGRIAFSSPNSVTTVSIAEILFSISSISWNYCLPHTFFSRFSWKRQKKKKIKANSESRLQFRSRKLCSYSRSSSRNSWYSYIASTQYCLRKNPRTTTIHKIACTCTGKEGSSQEELSMGFDNYPV